MTRVRILGLAIWLVLGRVGAASAAEPLSLAAAQAEARARAPEQGLFAAHIVAADALASDARRVFRRDPQILAGIAPGGLGGDASERDYTVGLRWSVDATGTWVPRRRSAVADLERTRQERDDGLRVLDEAVAVSHADCGYLQRQLRRTERLRELYALAAEAARKQMSAGKGNQIDLDTAELDLINADSMVVQLHGDLEQARIRLSRLLGRSPDRELTVDDPDVTPAALLVSDPDQLTSRDPRVRARQAEVEAANAEHSTFRRAIWAGPTFGIDYNFRRRSIEPGAFRGPSADGLSASWTDREITLSISAPIPMFDRQTAGRARTRGRIALAEAHERVTRANVSAEIAAAEAALRTAVDVLRVVTAAREIFDREVQLVELAVKAGALNTVERGATLRRLTEAGQRVDAAQRAYRIAQARWVRQTASLKAAP